jgi:mono/diheme cytochrome c family protein
MCVNCHLSPGREDAEIRPGLYPQPPKLSEQRFDPKAVFWVTKHGLKMSGMPAWGVGHDDATLWSIVAFVNKLPGLSAECSPSAPLRQIEGLSEGRISGSS